MASPTGPRSPARPSGSSRRRRSASSSAAGPPPAARASSRSSSGTTTCFSIPWPTKGWRSRRTSSTPARLPTSRSSRRSSGRTTASRHASTTSPGPTPSGRTPSTPSPAIISRPWAHEIVGEEYVLYGSKTADDLVASDQAGRARRGDQHGGGRHSTWRSTASWRRRGSGPRKVPVISFSIAEDELRHLSAKDVAGDYAAWNYFQGLDTRGKPRVRPEVQGQVWRRPDDQRRDRRGLQQRAALGPGRRGGGDRRSRRRAQGGAAAEHRMRRRGSSRSTPRPCTPGGRSTSAGSAATASSTWSGARGRQVRPIPFPHSRPQSPLARRARRVAPGLERLGQPRARRAGVEARNDPEPAPARPSDPPPDSKRATRSAAPARRASSPPAPGVRSGPARRAESIRSVPAADSPSRRSDAGRSRRLSAGRTAPHRGQDEARPVMTRPRILTALWSRTRISTHLLLYFLCISLIPCGLLTVLTLYISSRSLEHSVRQNLMAVSDAKATQLEVYIRERRGDMSTIGRTPSLMDATQHLVRAAPPASRPMRRRGRGVSGWPARPSTSYADTYGYRNALLFDPDGNTAVPSPCPTWTPGRTSRPAACMRQRAGRGLRPGPDAASGQPVGLPGLSRPVRADGLHHRPGVRPPGADRGLHRAGAGQPARSSRPSSTTTRARRDRRDARRQSGRGRDVVHLARRAARRDSLTGIG